MKQLVVRIIVDLIKIKRGMSLEPQIPRLRDRFTPGVHAHILDLNI